MSTGAPGGPRPSKNDRRDAAREKARQLREQRQKKERRRKIFLQGGLGLVVIAVVAIVAVILVTANRPAGPGPANMASDGIKIGQDFTAVTTGGLAVGATPTPNPTNAATVADIQVYVDYLCPYCGQFEATNSTQIGEWLNSGGATVEIHPLAILTGRSQGTQYSLRAANAAACVADYSPNSFFDFNTALFANQPKEGTEGLTDKQLIDLTTTAKVTSASKIEKCINDGTYEAWVKAATTRATDGPIPNSNVDSVSGTPTVIVNGAQYTGSLTDPAEFASFVLSASSDITESTPTPTPTPAG